MSDQRVLSVRRVVTMNSFMPFATHVAVRQGRVRPGRMG